MACSIDTPSKRRFSATLAARLTVAALLVIGTFAGVAASAAVRHGGGHHGGGHHGGGHRAYHGRGGGRGGGYYGGPPVVYGSPYYYAPPVVYGPGIGINLPGVGIDIR